MIEINGKVYRNIQEQVGENQENIEDLDTRVTALEEAPTPTPENMVTIDTDQTITGKKTFNPGQTFITGNSTGPGELHDQEILIKNSTTDNYELCLAGERIMSHAKNPSGYGAIKATTYMTPNYFLGNKTYPGYNYKLSNGDFSLNTGALQLRHYQYTANNSNASINKQYIVELDAPYTNNPADTPDLTEVALNLKIQDGIDTTTYSYPLYGPDRIAKLSDLPDMTDYVPKSIDGEDVEYGINYGLSNNTPQLFGADNYGAHPCDARVQVTYGSVHINANDYNHGDNDDTYTGSIDVTDGYVDIEATDGTDTTTLRVAPSGVTVNGSPISKQLYAHSIDITYSTTSSNDKVGGVAYFISNDSTAITKDNIITKLVAAGYDDSKKIIFSGHAYSTGAAQSCSLTGLAKKSNSATSLSAYVYYVNSGVTKSGYITIDTSDTNITLDITDTVIAL